MPNEKEVTNKKANVMNASNQRMTEALEKWKEVVLPRVGSEWLL